MKSLRLAILAFAIGMLPLGASAVCTNALPGGTYVDCTIPSIPNWGVLAVTNTSIPITTGLVAGTNSGPYPNGSALPSQGIGVYNRLASGGPAYFCPAGSPATAAACKEVGVGASRIFSTGTSTSTPTVICPLGCTLELSW